MIYLTTGANGAGKTLLTLRDVRAKSIEENRPVYHNGRFELIADFGWKVAKLEDWQSLPDGSIFIADECQNEMPTRTGKDVPEWIKMLAEHRRRGFDFFMITQHPLNIDAFVRRIIGAPGWHRHLKRASGAPLVSVLTWPSVNIVCEKAGAGATGETSMVPYPKEVYEWYKSTSLDTAKFKMPFQVKVLIGALVLLPLVGWYGWKSFSSSRALAGKPPAGQIAPASYQMVNASGPGAPGAAVQSPAQYIATYQPRLQGLAYTAPRYDALTVPTSAPFPAGCVKSDTRCQCYTEQGTKIPTTPELCAQIVNDGFYKDWGGGAVGSGPGAGSLGGGQQARQIMPNGPVLQPMPAFNAQASRS